jgi:hypothetical protein
MPDAEKRLHADFVVDTGRGIEPMNAALDAIIAKLQGRRRRAYALFWA